MPPITEIYDHQDLVNKFQRTPKGLRYQKFMAALSDELADTSAPAIVKANAALKRMKDVQPLTVHTNATLTNISVQYQNDEYIGDRLMPVAPVTKKSDVYFIYDKRSRLAYPDDVLGPRQRANEITDTRSTASYLCKVYGYENFLDSETLSNQDAPLNEMVDLTEAIAEGLAFRRELRIATVMTTSGNYSGNTAAIAAGLRWDTGSGGNPIKDIQDAIKALWTGRGASRTVMFSSYDVYLVLSRHPAILDLFKFSGTAVGLATPNMIAGFFGVDEYLVGKARKDTANEGQTAAYSRIWSDVLGVARVMQRPSIRNAAFGLTFRHGNIITQQMFDPMPGKEGGYIAKTATSEDHKVIAGDTGFLVTTPIG